MRGCFKTLLRALLSSFVILLVTTHSDEQLGQRSFLIRIYIRVIWFTRNTRLRRIWPTRKQNRRTSVPTLSLRSHTSKWRPKFPACRSILIAKDFGYKLLAGDLPTLPIFSKIGTVRKVFPFHLHSPSPVQSSFEDKFKREIANKYINEYILNKSQWLISVWPSQ